jgi:hypothetical protein
MRTNTAAPAMTRTTHEGAPSPASTATQELRRTVMACLLFEDQFYESGVSAAARIADLVKRVPFADAAAIAIDAREKMKLRHVPLLLAREMLRIHHGRPMGDLITRVIQRPDELAELVALYWKDKPGSMLPRQLKIGLGRAFKKFSPYQLAKYDRNNKVKLRDVLFMAHARPQVTEAEPTERVAAISKPDYSRGEVLRHPDNLLTKVLDRSLDTPDTWEVALSEGADKAATFTRLIAERKLGALALLRNLRGMIEAGVPEDVIRDGIASMSTERVLPFRFISAARYAPRLEDALEQAMFRCLTEQPRLPGKTALLIDHSGSMQQPVSAKSEISRFDAAAALAMILRETAERCRVFTFAAQCIEVPPRRGFALVQAVKAVVNPTSTLLGAAVRHIYREFPECDRALVITDEQSADRPPHPQGRGYIVNVGGSQNGIAYGPWVAIDGWSEAILDYVRLHEEPEAESPAA